MTNNDHLPILVTGAAGFIGFHLARRLLDDGRSVIGLDNLNDYYDPSLKEARLDLLRALPALRVPQARPGQPGRHGAACSRANRFSVVVHLAAQAGVRYSIDNPHAYVDSNLVGFLHILEGCRNRQVPHLVYASSSSVYGANTAIAVLGPPQRRPPGLALRRHQEGQRADGPHLRPPVRPAEPPACGSSPSTARGAGPTWRCSSSPARSWPASPSTSTTTATTGATSPTSTTSSRAWCG